MKEIWKPIKNYEGLYEVSNLGRIKSLPRRGTGNQEKILKPKTTKFGYYEIVLIRHYNRKSCKVHRLVAETFIPNPQNKPYINHKDFNGLNNHVDNLEWCTPKENTIYSRQRNRFINSDNLKKKKIAQYDLNDNLINTWNSITEASILLNIDKSHIGACCKQKKHYNTAGGYKWRYVNE